MSADIEAKELQQLRERGSVGRLRIAFDLHEFARSRRRAHLCGRHPVWSEEQLRAAVHTFFLGEGWEKAKPQ